VAITRTLRRRLEDQDVERMIRLTQHPVESPQWWVTRLYDRLTYRLDFIEKYDDYYAGRFPLPWLAPQAAQEFRRVLKMGRANYTGLVVDAQVERMIIEGFRIDTGEKSYGSDKDPKPDDRPSNNANPTNGVTRSSNYKASKNIGAADQTTWRIWQANNMDTLFDQGVLEAGIAGASYMLVAPNDKDEKAPKIWIEHASQCILEYKPGTNRSEVAAALKVWDDDWTQEVHAVLYLPDFIYKFKTKRNASGMINPNRWAQRRVAGESWPAENPIGEVPVFELPNNPRLLTGGRSELYDLCDIQDRINKTIVDRLMTQDYGAFPQKWATGWPEENEDGTPTAKINVGRDRMITTDAPETKFGQFAAAAVEGYMLGKKEDVHDMAARSRTPAQYLLGEFSNVNGETLKASESGLVAKVRQRMRGMDDPVESAIRLARKLAGDSISDDVTMEIIWQNPEFRTEGELVDALTKMATLSVPNEVLWERWGASPVEVQRWKSINEQEAERAAANDATALLADGYRKAAAGTGSSVPGGQPPQGTGSPAGQGAVRGSTGGANNAPRQKQPA
jgi:hypothetical protein